MAPVAVIFDNFGPYHVARLQAAAEVCDLLAIEVAGKSDVYAWDNDARAGSFKRVTLVREGTNAGVDRAELRRRLENALEQFKPRVVAIPGWASQAAWGAMNWCAQKRVPMICMSESTEWDEPRVGWKEWIKRKLVEMYASVLVGGRAHEDYIVKLGIPAERVFLGYDAVDNGYFAEKSDEARTLATKLRKAHGLPENYFLASARFVRMKNLPRLIEGYARYRELAGNDAAWKLVLLGDGELRPELSRMIADFKLQDNVVLPGFMQYPELPVYYGLANAFIHASSKEPWGLVVNEAMASALPVLVSNRCGCASALVQEGVNGFTFDPAQAEQIGELMLRMISMKADARNAMGKASREIVSGWGTKRFASGLKAAAESAMEAGSPQTGWDSHLVLRALMAR